jgi:hypothetical protein
VGNTKQLHKITVTEWRLFIEGVVLSAYCRFLIYFIPLRKFAGFMGQCGKESDFTPQNLRDVSQVKKTIARVSRRVPWRCRCYEQAFTGKLMLNRRKIPSTIYFGVAKDENNELKAHAWLRCGDLILTGNKEREIFTRVVWFS